MKFSGVTILQGVEFSIFPIDFEWALQQCRATALPVMCSNAEIRSAGISATKMSWLRWPKQLLICLHTGGHWKTKLAVFCGILPSRMISSLAYRAKLQLHQEEPMHNATTESLILVVTNHNQCPATSNKEQ